MRRFALQLEFAQRHGHTCPDCGQLWACVRACSTGSMTSVDVPADTPLDCGCMHVHKCPECEETRDCYEPCEIPDSDTLLDGEPDGGFCICDECEQRERER